MSTEERTFGGQLRGRRAEAGLNQAELGAMIGVTGSAIGNWERGEDEPTRDKVYALEQALNLEAGDLSRLLGYEPADTAPPSWEQVRDLMQSLAEEMKELRAEVRELRRRPKN
jgi:transcriptional regulator with XRE-family HTH domain